MGGVGVIELVVWDRETLLKKEHLGEVGVGVDNWFSDGNKGETGTGTGLAWDDVGNKVGGCSFSVCVCVRGLKERGCCCAVSRSNLRSSRRARIFDRRGACVLNLGLWLRRERRV
jgi:hypothetical protein